MARVNIEFMQDPGKTEIFKTLRRSEMDRYNIYSSHDPDGYTILMENIDPDGEWVKAEEAEAKIKELESLRSIQEMQRLQMEVERLRGWAEKRGHSPECAICAPADIGPCTCGLDNLLKGGE